MLFLLIGVRGREYDHGAASVNGPGGQARFGQQAGEAIFCQRR